MVSIPERATMFGCSSLLFVRPPPRSIGLGLAPSRWRSRDVRLRAGRAPGAGPARGCPLGRAPPHPVPHLKPKGATATWAGSAVRNKTFVVLVDDPWPAASISNARSEPRPWAEGTNCMQRLRAESRLARVEPDHGNGPQPSELSTAHPLVAVLCVVDDLNRQGHPARTEDRRQYAAGGANKFRPTFRTGQISVKLVKQICHSGRDRKARRAWHAG